MTEMKADAGKTYDYLVVGAGLFGATFANIANAKEKKVLVIDRRGHVAGNAYTEDVDGINVHRYGPHIFHTNDDEVWEYLNRFADFNDYVNRPIANYKGEMYSLPFNMKTFEKMWGVKTAEEAKAKIEEQKAAYGTDEPKNLEEQAISLIGKDIYERLVKGYTEKQWGRPCTELGPEIIKRLPVRFTYDDNYFNAKYQGIPVGGYTAMVEKMLEGIEVRLDTDYLNDREMYDSIAKCIIYTGPIDEYFGYKFGHLEFRSLRFETETIDTPDFQGNAVINYTDAETPWTRIVEHKWFEPENAGKTSKTIVTREFSAEWSEGSDPYYPINNERNISMFEKYQALAKAEGNVIFAGRLGEYKYYDMDAVVRSAFTLLEELA